MIRLATLHRRRPALRAEAPSPADAPAGEAPAPVCGWFDSSHELSAGLLVQEHRPGEGGAVLATLPLAAWLDLQLQGCRRPSDEIAVGH